MAATLTSEASGGSLRSKRAVYDVILYRARKGSLSVCEVVLKPHQFSYMTERKILAVDEKSLTELEKVSMLEPVCRECEWFHNKSVRPYWIKSVQFVIALEGHRYYKEK
jgi:spore germination cell wall hydrolase CwlJ-like protein